jgi:outer membrane receptor protein involved in Fe transport
MPNPDTVQEVQVSTSNTSAEYGRQVGGVFNVVTKSGTNAFHGDARNIISGRTGSRLVQLGLKLHF